VRERSTPLGDIFDPVRRRFANSPLGNIEFHAQTTSTNEDAFARLGDADSAGLTIVADHQTAGRGRKGRPWIASPGSSLLFTTILPRTFPRQHLWTLPFWTGLCVWDALRHLGFATLLQWPNDLLLQSRKCCGILCVSRVTGETALVGCGVGLNVQRTAIEPAAITPPPSYLSDVRHIDRATVLAEILSRFSDDFWLLDHPRQVARRWERAAGLPGKVYRLQVDNSAQSMEASAQKLGPSGELIVSENGTTRLIGLADARVIR